MLISYSLAPGIGARRGFTLAEVALALVLGALVLSLIFAIGGRLQKQMSREANRLGASEQLAAVAEVLPIDLRALAPGSGDIASGEARDSSIQLRQAVANALTCGGSRSSWILALYRGAGG